MNPVQKLAMEAMLATDAESSDAQLVSHFVAAVGVTLEIAWAAVARRNEFLNADPLAAQQPSLKVDVWTIQ